MPAGWPTGWIESGRGDRSWSAGDSAAGDWTGGGRRRHRHGIGAFATLVAALSTWFIVYDVILVGLKLPLPGRLGLVIAVFTVLRGLFRRIFRRR